MRGNQKIERQKTMNDTDTQYWLLNTGITDSLAYQIFEDNAGGLHMLIYQESLNDAHLIGACLSIMPDDIKACIANLEDWTAWEGLVDVKDYRAELAQIKNQCALVEATHVDSLGFVRATYWSRMGEAAKQAFKYRAVKFLEDVMTPRPMLSRFSRILFRAMQVPVGQSLARFPALLALFPVSGLAARPCTVIRPKSPSLTSGPMFW